MECSRWKDKSAAQCQGYSCEVLNRLVRDILCCTGNVSDFFGKAVINFLALLLPGMGRIPALALNSISASVWNAGLNAGLALLPPFHF